MPTKLGDLELTLVSASDLKKNSLFFKSNPYAVLKLGSQTFESARAKKTQSPEFQQEFKLLVTNAEEALDVELFDDKRFFGKDTPLGFCTLPAKDVMVHQEGERKLPLQPRGKEKSRGFVTVRWKYTASRAWSTEPAPAQQDHQHQPTKLRVTAVAARELATVDAFGDNDAYLVIKLGDDAQKTTVVKDTKDPVWNQDFSFTVTDRLASLVVECWDQDATSSDDLIGTVNIPLRDLEGHTGTDSAEYILLDDSDEDVGSVSLKVQYQRKGGKRSKSKSSSSAKAGEGDQPGLEPKDLAPGTVEVTVMKARDLLAKDLGGTSDPFAVVAIGKQSFKTKVVKKTLEPEWNEFFTLSTDEPAKNEVRLDIFDWDRFGGDDPLGMVELGVASLGDGQVREEWYRLLPPKAGVAVEGEVLIKTRYVSSDGKYLKPGAKDTSSRGQLMLQIIEARDLQGVDRGGDSDPYCVVYIDDSEAAKTKSIPKTLNPVWNMHHVLEPRDLTQVVKLVVMDKNTVFSDVFLGECLLPMAELQDYQSHDFWLDLQPPGKASGKLHVSAHYSRSRDEQRKFAEAIHEDAIKKKNKEDGAQFHVHLVEASNLKAVDSSGASDPYCEIRLGKDLFRSKVIQENLNPVWDEHHTFPVTDTQADIHVSIKDKNKFFADKELGSFKVPLAKFLDQKPHDDWFALDDDAGEVHFKFQFSIATKTVAEFAALGETAVPSPKKRPDKKGGRVMVHVIEARSLTAADRGGTSDPFCEIRLGKQKFKTKTIDKSLNPIWNEKHSLDIVPGGADTIEIDVYDWDMLSKNDVLGRLEIPLDDIEKSAEHRIEKWFPLAPANAGEIHLSLAIARSKDELIKMRESVSESKASLKKGVKGGRLSVMCVEARDLVSADSDGASDPYCEITVGRQKKKTKVINKTLNPIWDEDHVFPDIVDLGAQKLKIAVYDHDKFSGNDLLGEVAIPLTEFADHRPRNRWFPLQTKKGEAGEIHLKIVYSLAHDESKIELDTADAIVEERAGDSGGRILIDVIEAEGLRAADSNGLSDPYVVVKVGKQKKKTKHVKKSLSPLWNEQHALDVTSQSDTVQVIVYDYDVLGSDDYLGEATIKIADLADHKPHQGWHDLVEGPDCSKDAQGKVSGKIHLRLLHAISKNALAEAEKEAKNSEARRKAGHTGGHVTIKIIEAKGLTAADSNGLSDPYAVAKHGDSKFQTSTLKETLAPRWDEQGTVDVVDRSGSVTVTVFDWNRILGDPPLGEVNILLQDLRDQKVHQGWYPLVPVADGKDATGEIHLQMQYALPKDDDDDGEDLDAGDPVGGNVFVHIIEAKELRAADVTGSSDPYVVIKLGKQKLQTDTVMKSLAPTFNEQFTMEGTGSKLRLVVYDWDRFSAGDYLGEVAIDLGKLKPNKSVDQWYPLGGGKHGGAKDVTGEIRVLLRHFPDGVEDDADDDGPRVRTRLHKAIIARDTTTALALIEQNANLRARDRRGMTPLHWAAFHGNKVVATVLMEKGARMDWQDDNGMTPLMTAAGRGHGAVLEELLKRDARVDLQDRQGTTALHEAVIRGRTECCKALLMHDADCHVSDAQGMTPLHWAVCRGYRDCVLLLMRAGADKAVIDEDGFSAMRFAKALGHDGCAEVLEQA